MKTLEDRNTFRIVFNRATKKESKRQKSLRTKRDNCGTGAGGFQDGNTCATGSAAADRIPTDKTGKPIVNQFDNPLPLNEDGTATVYLSVDQETFEKIVESGEIPEGVSLQVFSDARMLPEAGAEVQIRVDPSDLTVIEDRSSIFATDSRFVFEMDGDQFDSTQLVPVGTKDGSLDTLQEPGILRTEQPENLPHNPQVDSTQFANWFGDGPAHTDGEPVQFYHGTKRDFDTLQGSERYENSPFFLTTDPEFASTWPVGTGGLREPGEEAARAIAKIEERTEQLRTEARERVTEEFGGKPSRESDEYQQWSARVIEESEKADLQIKEEFGFSRREAERGFGVRVLPVYAAPQKVFYPPRDYKLIEPVLERIARESDQSFTKIMQEGTHKYGNWIVYERGDVAAALQDMGFDAIWITEGMGRGRRDHSTLAIWDSTLVKSSIGNEGEFNPDDPRLTKSKSGDNLVLQPKERTKKKSLRTKQSFFQQDASAAVLSALGAYFSGQVLGSQATQQEFEGQSTNTLRILARAGRLVGRERLLTALTSAGVTDPSRLAEIVSGPIGGQISQGVISETTEKELRQMVQALTEGLFKDTTERLMAQIDGFGRDANFTIPKLRVWIEETYELSPSRAATIARTESARAYHLGQIDTWKDSPSVKGKFFLIAPFACQFCQTADLMFGEGKGKSVPIDQPFFRAGETIVGQNGGVMTVGMDVYGAIHPNCRCDILADLDFDA